MAFGFPASFSHRAELIVTRGNARTAIAYTFRLLGWKARSTARELFEARVPMSGLSWGERVKVSLAEPGGIEISSMCSYPLQFFDWGKNKRNVDQFVDTALES